MTHVKKLPVWYWIVTGFYLLWNGLGVQQYFIQANNTEAFRAKYTAAQLEEIAAMPTWVMRAYAVAVMAGFLASIFLMVRKRFAYPVALTSLVAVIAQMSYLFFEVKPPSIILPILVLVFSVLLLLFSKYAVSKKWLA
ncbi:hypothetical protein [Formosa algae]|uniref:Glucan phosphoethanolaminetransferase (Alkaline phosphatase superfamily) n=1 Tax=Formosa algae TaxID=225843 RepID=A0A9X0YQ02_9FLAO|nr:hypothetical protein [Formosa algae]MBP1840893.1 glucan phosphoethanolaminetransferase (alkaline phosphatase superfamily) [Formosa algae]MDQ0336210.1 glucan phosphoethanolaminetransferase (alkaline phosphatase superfamily) [Formosa algae]OEI79983.1 hypothetical protein AST99_11925 [Formosa algae]